MSFVFPYLDRFTARHFKEDEHGRTRFYPMGSFTSGRHLPDAVTAERMRRAVGASYLVLIVALAPVAFSAVAFFHRMSWRGLMVIVMLSVVTGACFGGWLQVLARGFPKSDSPLASRDTSQDRARSLGRNGLVWSMATSMVMGVASMLVVLAQPAAMSRVLALLSVSVFGACAIYCWLQLRALAADANSSPN